MTVVYRGSSKLADYYSADGATVRHGTHPFRPWVCLKCVKNSCEHVDAAEAFVLANGLPNQENAA